MKFGILLEIPKFNLLLCRWLLYNFIAVLLKMVFLLPTLEAAPLAMRGTTGTTPCWTCSLAMLPTPNSGSRGKCLFANPL